MKLACNAGHHAVNSDGACIVETRGAVTALTGGEGSVGIHQAPTWSLAFALDRCVQFVDGAVQWLIADYLVYRRDRPTSGRRDILFCNDSHLTLGPKG